MSTPRTLHARLVQSIALPALLQLYAAHVNLAITFTEPFVSQLVQILPFQRLIPPLECVRPAIVVRLVVLPPYAHPAYPVNSFITLFAIQTVLMDLSPLVQYAVLACQIVQPVKTLHIVLPASLQ